MRLPNTDPISKRQKEIIVGNILGDGWLESNGLKSTRFQMKQSLRYKEYIFRLYRNLENICNLSPKQRKDNKQWYFATKYLKTLLELRKLFYPEGKKIVPKNITKFLYSPLTLAVWYMDDGRLDWRPKDHFAVTLNTDCFSTRDVILLTKVLKDNFGIESSWYLGLCRKKRYPRIYIGSKGRDRFFSLVKPYILDCFSHKLPPL